jgi:hypothetical protein
MCYLSQGPFSKTHSKIKTGGVCVWELDFRPPRRGGCVSGPWGWGWVLLTALPSRVRLRRIRSIARAGLCRGGVVCRGFPSGRLLKSSVSSSVVVIQRCRRMTRKRQKVPFRAEIDLVERARINRWSRVDSLTWPFLAVWTTWKGDVDHGRTLARIGRCDRVWHHNLDCHVRRC